MSYRPVKNTPKKQKLRSKSSDTGKPGWDNTISDLTVHRLTSADIERRKSGRPVRNESSRCSMVSSRNSKPSAEKGHALAARKMEERQEEMLRNMLASSRRGQVWPGTKKSEKTLAVVRDVFEDSVKSLKSSSVMRGVSTHSLPLELRHSTTSHKIFPRYRGLPNITRAPDSSTPRSYPTMLPSDGELPVSEKLHSEADARDREAVRPRPTEAEEVSSDGDEDGEYDFDFDSELAATDERQDAPIEAGRGEEKSRIRIEDVERNSKEKADEPESERGKSQTPRMKSPEKKPYRMLKLRATDADGDVFDSLDMNNDTYHLIAPALDRTRDHIDELKKLVDALTLELITTNGRLSTLSDEFEEYKETSETKIRTLESMVRKLSVKLDRHCSSSTSDPADHAELMLDLAGPAVRHSPDSELSVDVAEASIEDLGGSDNEQAGGRLVHRGDILAKLEELQHQRDLAQARLQAIANL